MNTRRFKHLAAAAIVGASTLATGIGAARAQDMPVIFGMQGLLATVMSDEGRVRLTEYDAAFLPEDRSTTSEAVIADADGRIVARHRLSQADQQRSGAFARVAVPGIPDIQLPGPGVYNLFLVHDGEIATRIPFIARLNGDGQDDPFAGGGARYVYDGLWRQLGFMTGPDGGEYAGPTFTFWAGDPDLADPAAGGDRFRAALYGGSSILFHSNRSAGFLETGRFSERHFTLFHPHAAGDEAQAEVMTMQDLAALDDGEYVLRVFRESDGTVIRAFRIPLADGRVRQHERAEPGYEPRMDLILPRVFRRGSNVYDLVPAIWFETL